MLEDKNKELILFERIEKYVLGRMSPYEVFDFEDDVREDRNLRMQLKEHKLLAHAIEKQSLKDEMDRYHEDLMA